MDIPDIQALNEGCHVNGESCFRPERHQQPRSLPETSQACFLFNKVQAMHFECTFRSYPHSPPFGGLTIYIRLRTCCAGYNEKEDFCRMLKGKRETILVVDNDETVLDSVVLILERANFLVLSAHSGAEAVELAKGTEARIDLLLSDVDMPSMSGPDLGQTLKKARPSLRVMLMSGGTDGNLLVLNYGWAFIQKPLVSEKLVQMITEVLHVPDRSQSGGQEFESHKDTR